MAIHYLREANKGRLKGTALLRLDFNTEDDWRMRAVIPTVKFLLKYSDKIVVVSHKGRPNGVDKKFSLRKNAATLARLAGRRVVFIDYFRFGEIAQRVARAPRGTIFLLENLRFLKGEEANDSGFAKQLASLADFYVNDAFAVSHRANASVVAITKFLPSYAGFELEQEIKSLGKAVAHPKRPLVLILGGAKAADKLGVIEYFKKKANWFLLGGGPANTMLSLEGFDVKRSVRDTDSKDLAALRRIAGWNNILLPVDFVWSKDLILDLGPKSTRFFGKKLASARTVIWSGPLGQIEKTKFAKGSVAVARAIIANKKVFSVTGGGETVMFLKKYKLDKKFSFVSTGGGAMVDFLAGKKLPGIEALR